MVQDAYLETSSFYLTEFGFITWYWLLIKGRWSSWRTKILVFKCSFFQIRRPLAKLESLELFQLECTLQISFISDLQHGCPFPSMAVCSDSFLLPEHPQSQFFFLQLCLRVSEVYPLTIKLPAYPPTWKTSGKQPFYLPSMLSAIRNCSIFI